MATRSLLDPAVIQGRRLIESGPNDRYFDYCLEPYRPRRSWQGKLRAENLLWHSLALGGALAPLRAPLLALQSSVGRDLTVWGVKWDGARLFWEMYLYDPQKERPTATLTSVSGALRPWLRVAPQLRETVPYMMVSFDLDQATAERGTIDEVNLYLTGGTGHAGRSYIARAGDIELANTYRFFDPKREVEQVLPLLKASVFVDYSAPARLAKVLFPELFACKKVCVAKKRRCDAVYFSGIAVEQLLFFLRHFAYPAPLVDFVAHHQEEFEHLSFDVGIDYLLGPDGATMLYPKTSFYGTL